MNNTTTAKNYRTNTGSPVKDLIGTAHTGKIHKAAGGSHRAACGVQRYARLSEVRVWEIGETVTGNLCGKCFK